jgi:hypothetical protein
MGRQAAWEVCESWLVMGWEKFALSPGCDHAQTFLFAKSILADKRPNNDPAGTRAHLTFCSWRPFH